LRRMGSNTATIPPSFARLKAKLKHAAVTSLIGKPESESEGEEEDDDEVQEVESVAKEEEEEEEEEEWSDVGGIRVSDFVGVG